MFEKVNPEHPDKICDRVAGAIVDIAYNKSENPHIAVEVLSGHGKTMVICETDVDITYGDVRGVVDRIIGTREDLRCVIVDQDLNLRNNQADRIRCGDNGIFRGVPITDEQRDLSYIARYLYDQYGYDGKYILADGFLTICQSNSGEGTYSRVLLKNGEIDYRCSWNPIGDWIGGLDVDSGATNRKLGSDMVSATGGGLHGKDLSKADVSVNIYAHLLAQETGKPVELYCAIGDEDVGGVPYEQIVARAKEYIDSVGGFEKFAEWGLI